MKITITAKFDDTDWIVIEENFDFKMGLPKESRDIYIKDFAEKAKSYIKTIREVMLERE